jgi:3-oxoacyl-[acyl-carrier protein] reductase
MLSARLDVFEACIFGDIRATKRLDQAHEHFRAHAVDVTDEAAVRAAVAVVAESGRIDLLINNAGAAALNAFLLTPGSVAEKLIRVNYLGTFHCLQAVGKVMVRQRAGRIINLTTVAVPLSLEGEAAYVASKAAVEALTKVAAKELASQGVRVIALGFGPIDTRLTRAVPAAQDAGAAPAACTTRYATTPDVTSEKPLQLSSTRPSSVTN